MQRPRRVCGGTVIKFIELYRANQCLWNTACSGYGNAAAANSACRSISRRMRILGLGPREVARRIKNLNSVYEQESKRLQESRGSGAARNYKPRVAWFGLVDSFLRPATRNEPCDCDICTANLVPCQIRGEGTFERSDEKNSKLREDIQDSLSNGAEEKGLRIWESRVNADDKSKEDSSEKSRNNCVARVSRNSRLVESPSSDARGDEYESFGRYISAVLRKMPFEYAVTAQTEIHNVVIKYKIYSMRKPERNGYRCLETSRDIAVSSYGNSSDSDRRIKLESRSNSIKGTCRSTDSGMDLCKTSDQEKSGG